MVFPEYLSVRNWRQFQHYRDRNPPWIKLHFSLLSSRDWVTLDDASRVLAVACMLLASRNDGKIDCSEAGLEYIQRVAYTNHKPDLKPLIACGFLESASTLLAPSASTLLANSVSETETDSKQQTRVRAKRTGLNGSFITFWNAYPRKAAKGRAEKAWTKINPDEQLTAVIVAAIQKATESAQWTKDDGKFIPHPATWLNDRRWEDEQGESGSNRPDWDTPGMPWLNK